MWREELQLKQSTFSEYIMLAYLTVKFAVSLDDSVHFKNTEILMEI